MKETMDRLKTPLIGLKTLLSSTAGRVLYPILFFVPTPKANSAGYFNGEQWIGKMPSFTIPSWLPRKKDSFGQTPWLGRVPEPEAAPIKTDSRPVPITT